ncbi:MAG: flagellar biosynthesis anti-sigma factor FlgM [Cellulosilyticaceae bacterium]
MRIQNIQSITQAYGMQNQGVGYVKKEEKNDEVKFSQVAKDYNYAYKLAKQTPDVRTVKVQDIQARIEAGTYTIDAKKVSEKIIEHIDIKG